MSDDCTRLDKWLWHVRVFKTRALAARVISGKSVRVTRSGLTMRTTKPAFKLRTGDVVTVIRAGRLFVIEVLAMPDRRVSAPEAALCYRNAAQPETHAHA